MSEFSVLITHGLNGQSHFIVRGKSTDSELLKQETQFLFDKLRGNQKTFLRKALFVEQYHDFSSNEIIYHSGFRYTILSEEGDIIMTMPGFKDARFD